MTNDELNLFIKHYIEKDRTGRAIMLTGSWGIGKSYYIKNELIPFLKKSENGAHQCITVSLYGLTSLSEISRTIFLENMLGKGETKKVHAGIAIAKTFVKGLAGIKGIDISINQSDINKIYEIIDLSSKLIILEDVERTQIDILELLGYVNSLTEQDSVKVLLVTNEEEIIQYKSIDEKEKVKNKSRFESIFEDEVKYEYTENTIRYLERKEKSVGDTIRYRANLKDAIIHIIELYDNKFMREFANNNDAAIIVDLMDQIKSQNLRSVIFACQKTVDIYEKISQSESLSIDFYRTIFFGIVAFSLRMNSSGKNKWVGMEQYSQELGTYEYPLFRFCYDYILTQQIDVSTVPRVVASFEKMKLYDSNKTNDDPELLKLYRFYLLPEKEVIDIVEKITLRLKNPADISFYDYGKLASIMIQIKHNLGVNIDRVKELLVRNLLNKDKSLSANHIFRFGFEWDTIEEQEEFNSLRKEMINALNSGNNFFPDFDYLPEQVTSFYEYVLEHMGIFLEIHGFARKLDIPRFIEMFTHCTASQMDEIRASFNAVYRIGNIRDYYLEDLQAIEDLLIGIKKARDTANSDKVQLLQYKMFINALCDIKHKLSDE